MVLKLEGLEPLKAYCSNRPAALVSATPTWLCPLGDQADLEGLLNTTRPDTHLGDCFVLLLKKRSFHAQLSS